jgi:hypothetical protein
MLWQFRRRSSAARLGGRGHDRFRKRMCRARAIRNFTAANTAHFDNLISEHLRIRRQGLRLAHRLSLTLRLDRPRPLRRWRIDGNDTLFLYKMGLGAPDPMFADVEFGGTAIKIDLAGFQFVFPKPKEIQIGLGPQSAFHRRCLLGGDAGNGKRG